MNKSIIKLILLLFILSCNTKYESEKSSDKDIILNEKQISPQRVEDINLIVNAIIIQDSLEILKSDDHSNFLSTELRKLPIDIPERQDNGLIPPPAPGRIYLSEILNDVINNEVFFSTKDSSNLIAQNSNPSKFEIDKSVLKNINFTTTDKEVKKQKKEDFYRFYAMTIPIFSLDNKKAYVELDYHCGTLCGYGNAIYLKKIRGKWIIVEKVKTWIS